MSVFGRFKSGFLNFFRWVFTVVFLGGLISANLAKLADKMGWDAFLTNNLTTISNVISHWWMGFVLGFFGGASIVLWLIKFFPIERKWTDNARLTLVFDSELQAATPTCQDGVRYYYWYHFPGVGIDYASKQTHAIPGYVIVFLTLYDPAFANYSRARVIGGGLVCEILGTHSSAAVVRVLGDLRGRSLDVRFSKDPIPLD